MVLASTRSPVIIGGISIAAWADALHDSGESEGETMMARPTDEAERLERKQSPVLAFQPLTAR